MVKARSLQDLALIKQTLSQQAEREAALAAEKLAQERRAKAEKNLFQRAVGQVKPLASQPRVELGSAPAPPKAFQQKRDDDRVLRESLSDDFDVSTLLDTDDELSYRRSGIGTDVTQKLRKGHWSLQGQIDLHGLRTDEARAALGLFIKDAHKRGCVVCAWCTAKVWVHRANLRCSSPRCNAGWFKKMKYWHLYRLKHQRAEQALWWFCSAEKWARDCFATASKSKGEIWIVTLP
jgi:DNA-nicking Smr family endonuclease